MPIVQYSIINIFYVLLLPILSSYTQKKNPKYKKFTSLK